MSDAPSIGGASVGPVAVAVIACLDCKRADRPIHARSLCKACYRRRRLRNEFSSAPGHMEPPRSSLVNQPHPDPESQLMARTGAKADAELEFRSRIQLLDTIPFERDILRNATEPTFDDQVVGILRVQGPMQISDLVPVLAEILGITAHDGLEVRVAASPFLTLDGSGRVSLLETSAECLDIDFQSSIANGDGFLDVTSRDAGSNTPHSTPEVRAAHGTIDGARQRDGRLHGFLGSTDTSRSTQGADGSAAGSGVTNPMGEDILAVLRDLVDELDSPSRKLSAREIIYARFGLDGRPRQTLQEIGDAHRVTRERIRQIAAAGMKALRVASAVQLSALVAKIEMYARTLQIAADSDLMRWKLRCEFPGTDEPVLPWLILLREIQSENWTHLEDAGRTSLEVVLAKILQENGPLSIAELGSAVGHLLDIDCSSELSARIAASPAVTIAGSGTAFLGAAYQPDTRSVREESIRLVLQRDGPSHFSHVATELEALLSRELWMSPRQVHTFLERHKEQFAWAGPGTYRLLEVGEDPSLDDLPRKYARRRRRGIGDQIVKLLLTQQPRTVAEIESHILPQFVVNKGSVLASITQDSARRFVVTDDHLVYLAGTDIASLEAEKPDLDPYIDWNNLADSLRDFAGG